MLQAGDNSVATKKHPNLQQDVKPTIPWPFGVLVHKNGTQGGGWHIDLLTSSLSAKENGPGSMCKAW